MSVATPTSPRRAWIVSPAWDLVYLVLTPVLIVPVVLLAVRCWLQPEQVYLAVISFASLGHHLPGFMRAYGDRELFTRYRRRFLLAPPLVFALALVFTPPTALAAALHLPWTHLHGLELILLLWGTWHGLMQTYGFMRIYDVRRGENDRWTARLDHALCLSIFVAGVVFSDTRMFGIASAMWQSGLPLFGPRTLSALRWITGAASLVVLAAYAVNLVRSRRQGRAVNGVKLLLAAVTGWFYWYCGRLSTNLLIGIAMFEIYHAVQYNAIVWIYNRRLFARAGERFGPLGFLFRDRVAMLSLYLAAIAAYSSIRFFTAASGDTMFSGDLYNARQWLIALFVTSSLLHFYYDGFIWKVSEGKTRDNLVDEASRLPAVESLAPRVTHAAKWAFLLAIIATLIGAEQAHVSTDRQGNALVNDAMLRALAALTPNVPEAQKLAVHLRAQDAAARYDAGLQFLKRGDAGAAVGPLREAVKLDPTYFEAQLQLGDALMALNKPEAAEAAYRRAVALRPTIAEARVALADAQIKSGRLDKAEAILREGLARQPDSSELSYTLGYLLQETGRGNEAKPLLERAAKAGLAR